eukprot:6433996-Prymnesium_polylepis.2
MAYVRLVSGGKLVIQRETQSVCMSVRASSTPLCISEGSRSYDGAPWKEHVSAVSGAMPSIRP